VTGLNGKDGRSDSISIVLPIPALGISLLLLLRAVILLAVQVVYRHHKEKDTLCILKVKLFIV